MSDCEHILQHLDKVYIIVEKDQSYRIYKTPLVTQILGMIEDELPSLGDLFGLPSSKSVMIGPSIDQFFDNFMPPEVTLSLLPSRSNLHGRILAFKYTPIYDSGLPDPAQLLIEVADVTAEETKNRLKEIQSQQNEILLKILKDKETFLTFLKDSENFLDLLTKSPDQTMGLRVLHTLKGNSGAFGLSEIATKIHEIESEAEEQMSTEGSEVYFLNASYEISALLDAFLVDNFSILGVSPVYRLPGGG